MHCQKIINHIKNTKNDARSIKIKVMDKNTAVKTINVQNDKNDTTIITNKLDMHVAM